MVWYEELVKSAEFNTPIWYAIKSKILWRYAGYHTGISVVNRLDSYTVFVSNKDLVSI